MLLYLVRHGQAKSPTADPERHLSKKGRKEMVRMAEFLGPLHLSVGAIWHSSKTRALDTAEILAEVVASRQGLVLQEGLNPEDDVRPIMRQLRRQEDDLMIVGHLPFMGEMLSLLTAGDAATYVGRFYTGSVACLERYDSDEYVLRWLLPPDILS